MVRNTSVRIASVGNAESTNLSPQQNMVKWSQIRWLQPINISIY